MTLKKLTKELPRRTRKVAKRRKRERIVSELKAEGKIVGGLVSTSDYLKKLFPADSVSEPEGRKANAAERRKRQRGLFRVLPKGEP